MEACVSKGDWAWEFQGGNANSGEPTVFKTQITDGYEVFITLQENVDGVLICSGLDIQFLKKEISSPIYPINSRYFQLMGFGEILASARKAYVEWADIIDEAYTEIDIDIELADWTAQGPDGFPDKKYAALAYLYVKFIKEGLENPIAAISEKFGADWDKNTWANRIVEARNRELLTKPKAGRVGGKLTPKAEKALGISKTDK